jgi:hypothetical protein
MSKMQLISFHGVFALCLRFLIVWMFLNRGLPYKRRLNTELYDSTKRVSALLTKRFTFSKVKTSKYNQFPSAQTSPRKLIFYFVPQLFECICAAVSHFKRSKTQRFYR